MRGSASAWLVLALCLLCGLGVAGARAAEAITAIEIAGNRSVEPDTIRSRLQLAVGSPYDPAKADQTIKALFATGIFSDVRIERRGSTIVVRVVENPLVANVSVEGNKAIDKTKIEEQIRLKPRLRYTASRAHADAARIRELYRRQGRLDTRVETKTVDLGDGRVDVAFVVREADVTKVDSISFVGNRAARPARRRGCQS